MAKAIPNELLGSAESMACGAYFLSDGPLDTSASCSLLTAQSLECALKAFLLFKGYDDEKLRNRFGHNLEKAWRTSSRESLAINPEPSDWCKMLNSLYDSPHYLRYPVGINGYVMPERRPMLLDLVRIVEMVRQRVLPGSMGLPYLFSEWKR